MWVVSRKETQNCERKVMCPMGCLGLPTVWVPREALRVSGGGCAGSALRATLGSCGEASESLLGPPPTAQCVLLPPKLLLPGRHYLFSEVRLVSALFPF